MRETLKAAVRDHPGVREAVEAVQRAKERHEAVEAEVEGLKDQLRDLGARMEAVQAAGDPDGIVRQLSAERRSLRAALEDAEADLAAHEGALSGALRRQHEAALAAMVDVWMNVPMGGTERHVREALVELAEALADFDALERAHGGLLDWARHIVGRLLDGQGRVPQLEHPDPGIHPTKLAALVRAVQGAARDLPDEMEEAA